MVGRVSHKKFEVEYISVKRHRENKTQINSKQRKRRAMVSTAFSLKY
jgi:hypothetical protein